MPIKATIFNKMILLAVILLIPVLSLFVYFNRESEAATRKEIENGSISRLQFFLSQVETNLDRMSFSASQVSRDPSLQELKAIELGLDMFEKWRSVMNLSEKLRLLSSSNKFENQISLYMPQSQEVISSDTTARYSEEKLGKPIVSRWRHGPISLNGTDTEGFSYTLVEPVSYRNRPKEANFIVEISFADQSVMSQLDQYKTAEGGDPFLFDPAGSGRILNRSAEAALWEAIAHNLRFDPQGPKAWTASIRVKDQEFLVGVVRSDLMGMYLVNPYPMDKALAPIRGSRAIFYLSVAMLLAICAVATWMFYRHVQAPIKSLVRGVQNVKKGQFSFRIARKNNSEFEFLIDRFNEMAEEIQLLIENVYAEKLRSREAMLKQLQSQINPHFLYNTLNFIKTMAIVGNEDAVERMIVNLGEFYRYATRTENRLATVREEVEFIRSYLSIQQLRMPRLHFEIDIQDELAPLEIPRILLQPVVENAIVHGVEAKLREGQVRVRGERQSGGICRIAIEDNGQGLDERAMAELQRKIALPLTDEIGCGVWNVNQRLQLEFGTDAGLRFFRSELGGLGVELKWTCGEKEDDGHVPNLDRG